MIVGTNGSIFRLLLWQWRAVVLFAVSGTAIAVAHHFVPWLKMPPMPVAVVGGALGIFVSFRTNAAYARWWEGRQLWGRLINNSRMFATQVLAYVPDKQRLLIERHILYVHVLQFTSADEVRAEIWRLRDEVLAAFGTDEAIEAARRAPEPASPGEEAR